MAKQQQYPPMQYGRSRNPFGELTHSGYVPTYVGLPIDRMKETADVLQKNHSDVIQPLIKRWLGSKERFGNV